MSPVRRMRDLLPTGSPRIVRPQLLERRAGRRFVSYTSEEFFNAYTYWNIVKDEGFEVSNKGVRIVRDRGDDVHVGLLKGRTGTSSPFTKKDEDKWCSVETLTQTHPFRSCIASKRLLRSGRVERVHFDSYFDCCPIEEGPICNGDTRIYRSAVFLVQSVSPKKIDRRRGYLGKPKTEERRDDGHGEASEIDGKSLVEERVEKRFHRYKKMCFNIYL